MKLKEYHDNPILSYIKCERYINDGSPSKNNNTTSNATSPKSSVPYYDALEVSFEKNVEIVCFGENDAYNNESIIMHPDFIGDPIFYNTGLNVINKIKVVPTSSGRTVLKIDNNSPCFFKLAYPKCLGRLTRHMGTDKILSAVEVTDRLTTAIDKGEMNKKYSILKENKGKVAIINNNDDIYEWGMIKREFSPYPYIEQTEYMMPFFSLFAKEYDKETNCVVNGHIPFIIQFYYYQSKPPIDFLLEDVIFPLLDCYFESLLYAGIELEAHAQNMLITFNDQFQLQRIVCRDLESAGRDVTLMERLGLTFDLQNEYKCNRLLEKNALEKYPNWYITHSFMFDFKLGEYILTPLIDCFLEYFPNYDLNEIQHLIKTYNKRYVDMLPDFFPTDWCYYSSENFEKTKNRKVYIWEDNPKYR